MNYNHLLTITDKTLTTVGARYPSNKTVYTFKIVKEMADRLEKGDYLVANSKNGLCIVQVEEIHSKSQIDVEATYDYNWAFQKVDLDFFGQLHNDEQEKRKEYEEMRRANFEKEAERLLRGEQGSLEHK